MKYEATANIRILKNDGTNLWMKVPANLDMKPEMFIGTPLKDTGGKKIGEIVEARIEPN